MGPPPTCSPVTNKSCRRSKTTENHTMATAKPHMKSMTAETLKNLYNHPTLKNGHGCGQNRWRPGFPTDAQIEKLEGLKTPSQQKYNTYTLRGRYNTSVACFYLYAGIFVAYKLISMGKNAAKK